MAQMVQYGTDGMGGMVWYGMVWYGESPLVMYGMDGTVW